MIARITGILAEVSEDRVLLDRDGVGYEVLVPAYLAVELADKTGQPVTLHTLHYLEGSAASGNLVPRLAGFSSAEEKAAFQQFLSVKGLGVRKALKALAVPMAEMAAAIEAGDVVALAKLPGLGKRSAEQVVATLRGKFAALAAQRAQVAGAGAAGVPSVAPSGPLSEAQADALQVLVAWGDRKADAEEYLRRAAELWPDLTSPEEWIRAAYRVKAGGL